MLLFICYRLRYKIACMRCQGCATVSHHLTSSPRQNRLGVCTCNARRHHCSALSHHQHIKTCQINMPPSSMVGGGMYTMFCYAHGEGAVFTDIQFMFLFFGFVNHHATANNNIVMSGWYLSYSMIGCAMLASIVCTMWLLSDLLCPAFCSTATTDGRSATTIASTQVEYNNAGPCPMASTQ